MEITCLDLHFLWWEEWTKLLRKDLMTPAIKERVQIAILGTLTTNLETTFKITLKMSIKISIQIWKLLPQTTKTSYWERTEMPLCSIWITPQFKVSRWVESIWWMGQDLDLLKFLTNSILHLHQKKNHWQEAVMQLSIKSMGNRSELVLGTLTELCSKTTESSLIIPRPEHSRNKGFNNSIWATLASSTSRILSVIQWLNHSVLALQTTTRQIIWIKTLWSKMDSRAVTWRATTAKMHQLKNSRLGPICYKFSRQTKNCLLMLLRTKWEKSWLGYLGNLELHISWWAITNVKRR
jgi:hypothetical protein